MNIKQTYTYSDIGLVPTELSTIRSRDDVDPSTYFLGHDLTLPIIAAPMNTVVGQDMADKLVELGGVPCLPHGVVHSEGICSFSVKYTVNKGVHWGNSGKTICIDVANGFSEQVGFCIAKLKAANPSLRIITGNVASVEGYEFLAKAGADAVRCGIGGGHMCSTSIKTGVGVGQASLIRDITKARVSLAYESGSPESRWPRIIADGGIKTPGCVAKAIALGADVVMVGTLFGGCEESPGPVIKYNGKLYKQMAGQASFAVKRSTKYVEGDDTLVPYSGKLEKTWSKLEDGIRSAMSYMNCRTLEELRHLPDENFCLLSPSAKSERQVQF
jgi:IMP dehydrogenase/GMP reductase